MTSPGAALSTAMFSVGHGFSELPSPPASAALEFTWISWLAGTEDVGITAPLQGQGSGPGFPACSHPSSHPMVASVALRQVPSGSISPAQVRCPGMSGAQASSTSPTHVGEVGGASTHAPSEGSAVPKQWGAVAGRVLSGVGAGRGSGSIRGSGSGSRNSLRTGLLVSFTQLKAPTHSRANSAGSTLLFDRSFLMSAVYLIPRVPCARIGWTSGRRWTPCVSCCGD